MSSTNRLERRYLLRGAKGGKLAYIVRLMSTDFHFTDVILRPQSCAEIYHNLY